ncbi:DUF6449 domain-containing protein [Gracilibacillus alcaliphilus]|uniref:DUF6449 domain-containing protein n=1 Tax=Gracilibacillus alcaliphilus TaxID=1401441 RepID=UPI001958EBFB|nr:DUF6449 domain-containing protein [Gracilibacillus alcaliphilus]MBM7675819.1 ABC-2 type transport system permease protein [Gracilibacillus alcaliphilus]
MRSKIFSYKKELVKQGFRSTGWIGIAYLFVLVLIMPVQVLMEVSSANFTPTHFNINTNEQMMFIPLNQHLQILFIIIFPILSAVFACHYMHSKGSSDFMHSLPIKRSSIFAHQFIMGYIQLFIPVAITSLLMWALLSVDHVSVLYQTDDIIHGFYYTMLFNTLFFTSSFFVGHLTGNSFLQGVLTYIGLLFPTGIIVLIQSNLSMLLVGFGDNNLFDIFLRELSPIIWLVEYAIYYPVDKNFWYYWVFSTGFLIVAFVLYRVRPAEATQQAFAFRIIKPIFKFGLTFCMMLLGGFYFGLVQGAMLSWLTFGYALGAIVGYLLAEMLIQKTWRVFYQWKGFVIYLGISAILLLSVVMDWYGFENKIPAADQIIGVKVNSDLFPGYYYDAPERTEDFFIKDRQIIQDAQTLHEHLIEENISNDPDYYWSYNNIGIEYLLSNGKTFSRGYYVDNLDALDSFFAVLSQDDDFKKSLFPMLFDKDLELKRVYLSGFQQTKNIKDPETINRLMEALRQDYLGMDYQELKGLHDYQGLSMEFYPNEANSYYYTIPLTFEHVIDFLKEEGLLQLVQINEDSVQMIAIMDQHGNPEMLYDAPYEEIENLLKITDRKEINQLIDIEGNKDGEWHIGIYDRENMLIKSMPIDKSQVPATFIERMEL